MSDDYHTGLTRDLAPFGLRIPIDLKDRIKHAATENNRSISAEIIYALEKAYPAPSPISEVEQKLDRVMEKMAFASSENEWLDLVDHLMQIRIELSSVVEESARAQAQEYIERERKRNEPITEKDIPF